MSNQNPVVTIKMQDGGIMTAELYPEVAPNTVNNFISLVKKGFYNGLIFHRVISGFMIQGGDPEGTGMGGPDYTIKGEFAANGFKNELKHDRESFPWRGRSIRIPPAASSSSCMRTAISWTASMRLSAS